MKQLTNMRKLKLLKKIKLTIQKKLQKETLLNIPMMLSSMMVRFPVLCCFPFVSYIFSDTDELTPEEKLKASAPEIKIEGKAETNGETNSQTNEDTDTKTESKTETKLETTKEPTLISTPAIDISGIKSLLVYSCNSINQYQLPKFPKTLPALPLKRNLRRYERVHLKWGFWIPLRMPLVYPTTRNLELDLEAQMQLCKCQVGTIENSVNFWNITDQKDSMKRTSSHLELPITASTTAPPATLTSSDVSTTPSMKRSGM